MDMILGLLNSVRNTAYGYITGPAQVAGAPEQIPLQDQIANNEQARNARQNHVGILGPPANNHNNPENNDQQQRHQQNEDVEHGPVEGNSTHPNYTKMWISVLILGLSLIAVPGLVLGLITKEISVGIALSGAITPVVSLYAGLYYYLNKRDS